MKNGRHNAWSRFGTGTLVGATITIAIALIILSPLALPALDAPGRDWDRLSLIGESYGAISAVLGAAAVVAVTITLVLQQRQIRDIRRLSIRQMHTDLLTMAISDPELLKAWGPIRQPERMEPRLVLYTNLVLNYLILLQQTGTASEEEVRLHLKTMAASEWSRAYWASTGDVWLTARRAAMTPRQRSVVEIRSDYMSRPGHGSPD